MILAAAVAALLLVKRSDHLNLHFVLRLFYFGVSTAAPLLSTTSDQQLLLIIFKIEVSLILAFFATGDNSIIHFLQQKTIVSSFSAAENIFIIFASGHKLLRRSLSIVPNMLKGW